ncbi:Glycoside hydrolase superfamily [Rhypophila sp. PSN 637]
MVLPNGLGLLFVTLIGGSVTVASASGSGIYGVDDAVGSDNELPNVYRVYAPTTGDPTHSRPQFNKPGGDAETWEESNARLFARSVLGRRDATRCLDDGTCADGSCCSIKGTCGYGPEFCGKGNCTSGCTATAMCGIHSEGGKAKCGMSLCCSASGWCGTTDIYCTNADPKGGLLPCQQGFGSCQIKKGRTCGTNSGTTNGRTIGYYQGSNTRNRLCNHIAPKDIISTGYTHLYYSFASINPTTFAVVPAEPADVPLYTEFTALKSRGLQTWIAVGGFDFSDANQATHGTWSKMASTASGRAAFISSLRTFMVTYGFQGVDLDWEYPVAKERGGNPGDTANLVLLVKEMRAAFGTAFGISMALAPDYWYMRHFDAKAMESSVDFFGFMAYDLHGYWDADVKTLGSLVRGQADIREIANNSLPLWFAELNPAKINFGLALYGRGYKLKDKTCNKSLCPFSGPSDPGPCTNSEGVMSLVEIQQLIKQKNLTPRYNAESMMKELTWDDQWIGYDDADTIKAKKEWANNQCFGGTMAWSIDFNSAVWNQNPPPMAPAAKPTKTQSAKAGPMATAALRPAGVVTAKTTAAAGASPATVFAGLRRPTAPAARPTRTRSVAIGPRALAAAPQASAVAPRPTAVWAASLGRVDGECLAMRSGLAV